MSIDTGLADSHVFISGASGGIGLATAKLFLEIGCKVTLHYNSNSAVVDELCAAHAGQAVAVGADCTSEADVKRAFEEASASLGPINLLIVNHAIYESKDISVKDMSLEQWRSTMSVNLDGSFLLIRQFMRQMDACPESAPISVVMIGSTAGKFGEAFHADYASSKSAMMGGLLLSLKNELARLRTHARINCIAPGWVRTPMAEAALLDHSIMCASLCVVAHSSLLSYQALASTPLRKVGEPLDVARACVTLCSPLLSGHITGHVLDINGGMEGRLLNSRQDLGLNPV